MKNAHAIAVEKIRAQHDKDRIVNLQKTKMARECSFLGKDCKCPDYKCTCGCSCGQGCVVPPDIHCEDCGYCEDCDVKKLILDNEPNIEFYND